MTRVALTTGSYSTRSIIASAQRSLNLYAEKNPPDALSPYTHYLTQGLTPVGTPPTNATVRGLFTASNNQLFAAVGIGLYYIASDWSATLLTGALAPGVTPIKMQDNGNTLVVVDGSLTPGGFEVDLPTHVVTSISDVAWLGSNFVEYVDTYLLFHE